MVIQLQYTGPMIGSFTTENAPISGKRYVVEGTGTWVTVAPEDVEWLMGKQYAGIPLFRRYTGSNSPDPSVPLAFNDPLPESDLPDITTLSVQKATELIEGFTDVLDLRVFLAQEGSQDKPRKTLIAAIEGRLKELDID
jgi:hypothetical protein